MPAWARRTGHSGDSTSPSSPAGRRSDSDPIAESRCNLGASLVDLGDVDAAIGWFQRPSGPLPISRRPTTIWPTPSGSEGTGPAPCGMPMRPRGSTPVRPRSGRISASSSSIEARRKRRLAHGLQAVCLRPQSVEPLVHLGNVLQVLDRLDEAEVCFREAIRLRPDSASALAGLGAIHEQQGDPEQSLATFREALRHDPRMPASSPAWQPDSASAAPGAEQAAIEGLLADPGLPSDQRSPALRPGACARCQGGLRSGGRAHSRGQRAATRRIRAAREDLRPRDTRFRRPADRGVHPRILRASPGLGPDDRPTHLRRRDAEVGHLAGRADPRQPPSGLRGGRAATRGGRVQGTSAGDASAARRPGSPRSGGRWIGWPAASRLPDAT